MNIKSLFDVKEKKIIVTGGTRGIGRAITEDLIADDAIVTVVAKNKANLSSLSNEFPQVNVYECDLENEDDVHNFCSHYIADHGYCDILINNAGISKAGKVSDILAEDLYSVFKVNLFAPFLMIKHFLPYMKERHFGVILNVASTLGTRAVPAQSAYCSSKSALIHFTRCLSIEVASFNIRVNCISPGFCRTDLNKDFFDSDLAGNWIKSRIPQQRLLKESELLPVVRLLISNAGSYITGSNIVVDGGVGNW